MDIRPFPVSRLGLTLLAIAATSIILTAAKAPAQVAAPLPSSFPLPTPSPAQAVTGSITASQPFVAQLQMTDGSSMTLQLHHGTTILDPKLHGLAVGQRVYVLGFVQSNGSLRADEIDVMMPLLTSSLLPTPMPATPAPATPAPAATR
jgi:hypothetical protein